MCKQQLAQSETSGAENNTTRAIISDRQRCFEKKKLKGSGDFTPETLLLSFIKKILSLIPLHAVVHWLVVFLPLLTIFAMITALGNTVFVVKLVFAHITGAALYFYSVCLYPGMKSVLPFQRLTIIPETPAKGFNKRVAVIGAGPMGLATAKELLEQGHEVTCYDASPMLGGEFANRFWTGGHLTSSPYITAFSDFEPLKCEATGRDNFHHLSKEDYVTYLEKYSAAHGVTATLCLNEKVVRVLTKEGRHSLVLQNAINGTKRTDEDFDHVAVCTGVNSTPSMYKVDGMGTFPGQILHSSDFARKDSFEETFGMLAGKRVLTLGIGESMADLIYLMNTSTSTPPSSCTASIARKGTFVIPRVNPLNNEINDFDTTRLRYSMPRHLLNLTIVVCMYLRNVFSCKRCKEGKIRFDLFRGMKWPAYSKATKSDNFVKSIAAGMCDVKVGVSKINNRSVHFVDGSVLEDVDVIIFGTGFTTDYPFVKETRSLHGSNKFTCFCPTKRFLRMFDPSFGDSIAFIGPGTRPIFGSNPTVGEAQVRKRLQLQIACGSRRCISPKKYFLPH